MLLRNRLDALVNRTILADAAERSIDVQYYLYHNDLVGHLLMEHLLKTADRGVRIHILVDDMDLSGKGLGVAYQFPFAEKYTIARNLMSTFPNMKPVLLRYCNRYRFLECIKCGQ